MGQLNFPLPDVGEGLTEAEIISWRVKPGDAIVLDQVFVEIETAKSLVELPSPVNGTIRELLVAEGVTVEVGTPIIVFETDDVVPGGIHDAGPATVEVGAVTEPATAAAAAAGSDETSGAVLVGHGTSGHAGSRRRKGGVAASAPAATPAAATPPAPLGTEGVVLAKPPTRKLAKELGIDLRSIRGTGAGGIVTRDDVMRASQAGGAPAAPAAAPKPAFVLPTPNYDEATIERVPVKGVRKVTASAMVFSAFSAPHVSLFVDIDATATMDRVAALKADPSFEGVKVSPLLIVARAVIRAAMRNPQVNASWTDEEIILKSFVNLGIAAATPRGLIVPNIKNAHELSERDLASAIEQLAGTAREGRTSPADQQGGSITITNIGVFGMDTGTPIINPGEAGIVAFGTIKLKPWVVDGQVVPRMVTTLGGSFDHRLVDGDVASTFLADVAAAVENPSLLDD